MKLNFPQKLRALRAEHRVSQEKLAQYLNVSFQAVSKWERGENYPDITLLPDIARFFGITVDELLQAEKLDEAKLYAELEERAADLFRNGDHAAALEVWREAYRFLPNDPAVKEKLMSSYFDADKVKYRCEITELGTELYDRSTGSDENDAYYRGQAITELARTYAANGDLESAERWASRAGYLFHSQELLFTELTHGRELAYFFRRANYWYFRYLFYMACRVANDPELSVGGVGQRLFMRLGELYEVVYPSGDADFETLACLTTLHRCIAEDETIGGKDESVISSELEKAAFFAEKSVKLEPHKTDDPLFIGMQIEPAPSDSTRIARMLADELKWECFAPYREREWFVSLEKRLEELI